MRVVLPWTYRTVRLAWLYDVTGGYAKITSETLETIRLNHGAEGFGRRLVAPKFVCDDNVVDAGANAARLQSAVRESSVLQDGLGSVFFSEARKEERHRGCEDHFREPRHTSRYDPSTYSGSLQFPLYDLPSREPTRSKDCR